MKRNVFCAVLALFSASVFAFDWPQDEVDSDAFYSYFGQLRDSTINSSLIFKDSSKVKAADSGEVVIVINEHGGDFGWFESSLGNAVIISHKDSLETVYGNLDESTVAEKLYKEKTVESGEYLGVSGNSAWQDGQSCLEFKVIDARNKAAVNPRILMPRVGKELKVVPTGICLFDKKNNRYSLNNVKVLANGNYAVCRLRDDVAVPYKTVVSINGASVETIEYDMLIEDKGKLCVNGNSRYSIEDLYVSSDFQLLGNVQLIRGHNTLSVSVENILGTRNSITYNLDAY